MSLAAGAGTRQYQPTLGVFSKPGGCFHPICEHLLAGYVGLWPFNVGGGEGYACQGAQIAVAPQRCGAGIGILALLADAWNGLSEVRMAYVDAARDPPAAVALRAEVNGGLAIREVNPVAVGIRRDISGGYPPQYVAQAFHLPPF